LDWPATRERALLVDASSIKFVVLEMSVLRGCKASGLNAQMAAAYPVDKLANCNVERDVLVTPN
jgi:hypothetical protein